MPAESSVSSEVRGMQFDREGAGEARNLLTLDPAQVAVEFRVVPAAVHTGLVLQKVVTRPELQFVVEDADESAQRRVVGIVSLDLFECSRHPFLACSMDAASIQRRPRQRKAPFAPRRAAIPPPGGEKPADPSLRRGEYRGCCGSLSRTVGRLPRALPSTAVAICACVDKSTFRRCSTFGRM